jgi:hypothetical protein
LPILDFFFFQLEKVLRDLKRYKNPGLGRKSPIPTPQSWKHPGNLAKIPEISWQNPGSPGNLGNLLCEYRFF